MHEDLRQENTATAVSTQRDYLQELKAEPSFSPLHRVVGHFKPILLFAFRDRWPHFVILLAGVCLFLVACLLSPDLLHDIIPWVPATTGANVAGAPSMPGPAAGPASGSAHFADVLGRWRTLISFLTLLVAFAVWLGGLREGWIESLPKRMTVFFFLGDRPRIVCRNVWLAGPGDLRAWSQQVASQAVGGGRLEFSPDVLAPDRPMIGRIGRQGVICQHFAVRFNLIERQPRGQDANAGAAVTSTKDQLQPHPGPNSPPVPAPQETDCYYQNLAADDKRVRAIPADCVLDALVKHAEWPSIGSSRNESPRRETSS
jgi:hypothetical protein